MQSYHSKSEPYSSVHQYLPTDIRCDLYLPACVKTKLKQLRSLEKKTCFKKVQKLKKSWLSVGLNPQLRWLTNVCLSGFDRNVQQLFTVFSLHQCLQCAVMNEWKQLSFSNHHSRVPRWRVFNFAQVSFRCVLGMPRNSVIKAELKKKNVYAKSIDFRKKICSPPGFEPTTSWMQVSYSNNWAGFWWNVARGFSTSSSSTRCRTQSDHCINLRWQTWSRKIMGLYDVRQLISWYRLTQASYQCDGQTDGQSDGRLFQLYIYRLYYIFAKGYHHLRTFSRELEKINNLQTFSFADYSCYMVYSCIMWSAIVLLLILHIWFWWNNQKFSSFVLVCHRVFYPLSKMGSFHFISK